jgi:hypothetical protein
MRIYLGLTFLKKKSSGKLRYDTGIDCPFVGGKFYNGQLYLHNWRDIYLIVDPSTGQILERSLSAKS